MAFRTKKISQMDPKGSNLASTDLLEISQLVSGSYVTKSITGADILSAIPAPTVSWGEIQGTLSNQSDLQNELNDKQDTISLTTTGSSGAATFASNILNIPNYALSSVPTSRTISTTSPLSGGGDLSANRTLSIAIANTSTTGALTSTDWNTFNNKQDTLVSATNIKTINGSSVLGSGDLAILSAPSFLEYDNTNKTLWNNGLNDNATTTSFGQYALQSNFNTGHGNSAFGCFSLQANTFGTQNTSLGNNSLPSNTSGSSNTAIGSGALYLNITNNQSTAVGADALYNSRANVNTAIGYYAGRAITTGSSNTAIGANSLLALTTASNCIGIGQSAGSSFTTSINNIAIGSQSATVVTTGNNNVFVGHASNAASGLNTTTQCVVIGASAIGRTGCVVLGNGATATNINQFVVGSSTVNAGAVTTETLVTTKTWSVIINGVAQKILLA